MPPRALATFKPFELVRYKRQLHGKPMYITSNPTVAQRVMTGHYPHLILIVTNIEAPDHEGLPLDTEASDLNESEDMFIGLCAGLTSAMHQAGRITHAGQRVLVFYSGMPFALGPGPSFWKEVGGYRWTVYYENDPHYHFLQALLLPTPVEHRRGINATKLAELEVQGDTPVKTRPIACFSSFPSDRDVAAAIALLSEHSFEVGDPEVQRDRTYRLKYTFNYTTDPDSIDHLTAYSDYLCRSCNGQFLGWEAEPIR